MNIYANIPKRYVYSNKGFSDKTTKHKIIVGDIYKNNIDTTKAFKTINQSIIDCFDSEIGAVLSDKEKAELTQFIEGIFSKYKVDSFNTIGFV